MAVISHLERGVLVKMECDLIAGSIVAMSAPSTVVCGVPHTLCVYLAVHNGCV